MDAVRQPMDGRTPAAETHYHARFYFDPNGLSMASGDGFKILITYTRLMVTFSGSISKAQ
jgi:hypothetical protein